MPVACLLRRAATVGASEWTTAGVRRAAALDGAVRSAVGVPGRISRRWVAC